MSDLNIREKLKLEKFFEMDSGYVLDFSNRTLGNFVVETLNLELYSENYANFGDSKANRIRAIWHKEGNNKVGKLISDMLDYWKGKKEMSPGGFTQPEQNLYDECHKIAQRLLADTVVDEIGVIKGAPDDKDFSLLAKSIREGLDKNQPEAELDRLHTYVIKFIRQLCKTHTIEVKKNEPLNAIFGKYVKFVVAKDQIESEMAVKILKHSIHLLEAFNQITNNKSFAHDNPILNYSESILIFNNMTNLIKFIESVEKSLEQHNKTKETESANREDLPF